MYYCDVSDVLEGGEMIFRPLIMPDRGYSGDLETRIKVQEGTAMAFANTMPHKFQKITNNGKEAGDRMFVTFFIVDPERPIETKARLRPQDPVTFKKQACQAMMQTARGWGYLDYGNSGEAKFVDESGLAQGLQSKYRVVDNAYTCPWDENYVCYDNDIESNG